PSSPFAFLLRRSKFASYDPTVGQVYTAHGGDAHRGNYGLKRPITLNKRKQYITVQAVDSREQQTEWHRAESEARWMQRWDEIGTMPTTRSSSAWDRKLGGGARTKWVLDSEFGKGPVAETAAATEGEVQAAEEETVVPASMQSFYATVVPNIERMHPKEFERYLEHLREQRPAFLAFLEKEADRERERRESTDTKDLYKTTVAHDPSDVATTLAGGPLRRRFLSETAHRKRYGHAESQDLEPQPHRVAGATYSHESPLTQYFLTKAKVGRYLNMEWQPAVTRASFAGMAAYFDAKASRMPDDKREAIPLRVTEAKLSTPPTPHGGLQSTELALTVMDPTAYDLLRANPHRPGTPKYVAHGDAK
ncbi:mitochondrial ribosomal protein subunit-domain-containing protein, partial [Amylostereum chailletii]